MTGSIWPCDTVQAGNRTVGLWNEHRNRDHVTPLQTARAEGS
jgi:hypothetical protein